MRKSGFTLLIVFLASTLGMAQQQKFITPTQTTPPQLQPSNSLMGPPQGTFQKQGTLRSFWIQYDQWNYLEGGQNIFIWRMNNNFVDQDTLTVRYAAVSFDSLYSIDKDKGYPRLNNTQITVDSIQYIYNHTKLTPDTINDTIITSIVTLQNNGFPTQTALWSDTIITDSSLTSAGTFDLMSFTPNDSLPPGQSFGVRVDYKGPKQDSFYLQAGFIDKCNQNCISTAASIYPNSFYYLNWISAQNGNLSGGPCALCYGLAADCNQNGQVDSDNCELYYIQNWEIFSYVTVDQPFTIYGETPDSTVCPGESLTLSAKVAGAYQPQYQWSPSGNCANCQQTTVSPNSDQTYQLVVTDSNGTGTKDTVNINVTVARTTVDAAQGISGNNDTTINCGDQLNVIASVSGYTTGGVTFDWSNIIGNDDGSTNSNLLPGTYVVTATNNQGCSSKDTLTISNSDNVSADFTYTIDSMTVNFSNQSSNATSYTWDFDDGNQSTKENPSHTYASPSPTGRNYYQVKLTAENDNGCQAVVFKKITESELPTVGIKDGVESLDFKLYPNPTQGHLTLLFDGQDQQTAQLSVYNIAGEVVLEKELKTARQSKFNIDMSGHTNGIYLIKMQTDDGVATKRVMLNR